MPDHDARHVAETALLDAAERLLIETGYATISTRRLAEEARINHGMVHYCFGSMENLFLKVLERFTNRLIARQKAMYAADIAFIEKWRTAMTLLDADQESGYQKLWLELQAMAWNRPEMREQMGEILGQWRAVLTEAFTSALPDYAIDTQEFPIADIVTLVVTFNEGIILERLSGISIGHADLLAMIDRMLVRLEGNSTQRKESPDESAHP